MKKTTIKCLGIIMDGNRRWAKDQGLTTLEGHKKGGEVFADSIEWVAKAGIEHAVYYAFSTENWKRSKEEVEYLMKLFADWLSRVEKKINSNKNYKKIRVKIIGRREDFSLDLQKKMRALEKKTSEHDGLTVWIALSYGGRAEILEAVNKAISLGKEVDEKSFRKLFWTAKMPDPDVILRPGGEKRLSNFLTWQSVYSELIFVDKYWPALTKQDFTDILMEYESRERRGGS